jgi:hypothetical protein
VAASLLGLLACARRPLSWSEIQGAISIDLDKQDVDFEERQLRVDSKSLCGSFVEYDADGRVRIAHHTVKLYVLLSKTENLTHVST